MPGGNKENHIKDFSRRNFLKTGLTLSSLSAGAIAVNARIPTSLLEGTGNYTVNDKEQVDEVLYNGITLLRPWPPVNIKNDAYDPMPIPYLTSPPTIIPIDIGRQLFVDDFLIEYTDTKRKFHQPKKYKSNPIFKPETTVEMNKGYCPAAAPFSDGCFYDPKDKLFKLWYMAGWFDGTALATSKDGIHWTRPQLDVVPGTNLVLSPRDNLRRDGVSVWLDHESKHPDERFKMYLYARQGEIGNKLTNYGAFLLTSGDGVHWKWSGKLTGISDNNTFFYNPFRKKWVFTIRKESRPIPPWSQPLKQGGGRARSYWENEDFNAALSKWDGSVFWFGADRYDVKRPNYAIGEEPQIYKVDAAGYESIMIGLIQVHYGPANEICAKGGYPKLTEVQLAFSRDGFHWDRTNRTTFIGGSPSFKNSWERAYIHPIGGVCTIIGDKMHFYYTAFKGNEANRNPLQEWNGMYANASMGVAVLRRDGFASMESDKEGILLTKPITFKGSYLFINTDSSKGYITIEVCDLDGKAFVGYSLADCMHVTEDSTKFHVRWKGSSTLEQFAGQKVRLRFYLNRAILYSFWISQKVTGESGGATAAGGPGFNGIWDI